MTAMLTSTDIIQNRLYDMSSNLCTCNSSQLQNCKQPSSDIFDTATTLRNPAPEHALTNDGTKLLTQHASVHGQQHGDTGHTTPCSCCQAQGGSNMVCSMSNLFSRVRKLYPTIISQNMQRAISTWSLLFSTPMSSPSTEQGRQWLQSSYTNSERALVQMLQEHKT